jgi:cytochrome c5
MSDEHEAFIKTPQQLITVVALSFVVPVLVIVLLVKYVSSGVRTGAGADTMSAESIEARIRPVAGFELAGAGGPRAARSGEAVYNAQCAACHNPGVAGAPKMADTAAWAPRIQTGLDAMVTSALKGKGAMGAQGGGDYSDLEIARAVFYMANSAGGKFDEPKEAAAPAAAAPAPASAPAAAPAPAPAAAAPAPASAPVQLASANGKAVYDSVCGVCHNAGIAGAHKLGDKAAWAPHLADGIDGLTRNAITGIRAMPARGGNPKLTDAEVRAAVEYMVAAVQ